MGTLAWRFPLCLAALGWASARWGEPLAQALLPAVAAEIGWLDNTYRIVALDVVQRGGEQLIRIVVTLARCVVLPDGAHCSDPRAQAQVSTLLGHFTLPPTLAVAAVLAWPASGWREGLWRLPLLALGLAVLLALDVPVVLWASLWQLHVEAFAPQLFSPLLLWLDFLQGGGRMALALVCAAAVVSGARALGRAR
ncbi:MAG: hypothetical protein IIA02_12820 [Proteobacteria bacterium]|uniref:hypothetical protein n=1 Tax=Aquabacterium sp. TaxID=1872578 RepID=UPI0035C6737F|nr:hypothetical protein [Pseudomonadota bacterium]